MASEVNSKGHILIYEKKQRIKNIGNAQHRVNLCIYQGEHGENLVYSICLITNISSLVEGSMVP